ncbi:MAG: lactate utilization protein [Desulfobacteraceae bacterium]
METPKIKATFIQKAESVSAFVYEVTSMDGAFRQTLDLCRKKEPCRNLVQRTETKKNSDSASPNKTIAAPGLSEELFNAFDLLCRQEKRDLVQSNLRRYAAGLDIGFTIADFGIAETGTLVIGSDSEETRLATMICDLHVALVPESKIAATALEIAEPLKEMTAGPSSYTAFVTGASRTADIERVLAIGVHGPVELHIIILAGE